MIPKGPLPIPVVPRGGKDFTWAVPGSKSLTNRALPIAALAQGKSVLSDWLESDDTSRMKECLTAMGAQIRSLGSDRIEVQGMGGKVCPPAGNLFVGNSGTTVRFLAAIAAVTPGAFPFVGDSDMARRPIKDLVQALEGLGAHVECPTGCPPLTIHGEVPKKTEVSVRVDASSQYLSGLLMAAPLCPTGLTIRLEGKLVSAPYIELTLGVMKAFGIDVQIQGDTFIVPAGTYQTCNYTIEPDASSASYPFAAAAALGMEITVPSLGSGALQGDYRFSEILEILGATVMRSVAGTTVKGPKKLRGVEVSMRHISDTVMTLAALAPLCSGPVIIRDIGNIRLKETDRLQALVTELTRLGQKVEHGQDWIAIDPQPVTPCVVECYRDHRMAMAFAILGLCVPGVVISDPACVAKTYPGFWNDLKKLIIAKGVRPTW